MMDERENTLRAVRFEGPERIPLRFHLNSACWHHYPQAALEDLMEAHTILFPNYRRKPDGYEPDYAPWQTAGKPYTDPWGCVWETTDNGTTGTVTKPALENWDDFDTFRPPDPEHFSGWTAIDWEAEAAGLARACKEGRLVRGGLRHGHTFLTLTYIRGYENLLYDMADEEPRLYELIRMVEEFNAATVKRYIDLGVEWMGYAEDLGMQVGPMLSPDQFVKYIKPSYKRLIAPARRAGCVIHMHSDGDIRELVEHLIEGGVEAINLQDLVNGIDWIREHLTGKVCVDLDVDRQKVTRFGTPARVDALIREEVEKLGSGQGGLMLNHGLYPGIPLENVKALMDAMEKYAGYYS